MNVIYHTNNIVINDSKYLPNYVLDLPKHLTNLIVPKAVNITNKGINDLPKHLTNLDLSENCHLDSKCIPYLPENITINSYYLSTKKEIKKGVVLNVVSSSKLSDKLPQNFKNLLDACLSNDLEQFNYHMKLTDPNQFPKNTDCASHPIYKCSTNNNELNLIKIKMLLDYGYSPNDLVEIFADRDIICMWTIFDAIIYNMKKYVIFDQSSFECQLLSLFYMKI